MPLKFIFIHLFWLPFALAGCALLIPEPQANDIAQQAKMVKLSSNINGFELLAYSKLNSKDQTINVYIEGDGLAWISRYELSKDPTPKFALALKLASLDTHNNVIYLARPCQFNDFKHTSCASAYWSNKRFSEEVIDALDKELDKLLMNQYQPKINLIGYSGGGAVAVLLAARRHDIMSLRTIAGNLDHEYLNQLHHVSAMPDSHNPINFAKQIRHISQIHFIGINDEIIPEEITLHFMKKQGKADCASMIKVKANHQVGWTERWQNLLQIPISCHKQ